MTTFRATRTYATNRARLFSAFADHALAPEIVPEVVKLEFLPGPTSGTGTRFVEHRRHGRKVVPMEFEVTDFQQDELLRVANSFGGPSGIRPCALGATVKRRRWRWRWLPGRGAFSPGF